LPDPVLLTLASIAAHKLLFVNVAVKSKSVNAMMHAKISAEKHVKRQTAAKNLQNAIRQSPNPARKSKLPPAPLTKPR
jgi:hypothetical protein